MMNRILFLHGGGLTGRQWTGAKALLAHAEVLAPDLPGHGARTAQPLTLDGAVAVALGALAGQTAHVVGHSLGGTVARTLAARHPELVTSLLLSGSIGPFTLGQARMMRWAAHVPVPPRLTLALSLRQFRVPPSERLWVQDALRAALAPAWQDALIDTMVSAPAPVPLPVRTLLLVGQQETWAARVGVRRLSQDMGRVTALCVPGVGHVWNWEKPELFMRTVRAWVEEQALPDELTPLPC